MRQFFRHDPGGGMRLLITGINGVIGNILRRALAKAHDIYGLDREGEFSDRIAIMA
jgi:nucleoside-diphosphate-sugar epimerase